jgi:O-antigen/teichoic acid export membrane protein
LTYGAGFAGSIITLQIMIWTLVFTSTNYLLANLLISMDKQKLDMASSGLCAIVNIALNLILIPMLNYNGAAIATVATTAVLFLSNFYFVSKHLQLLPIHKIVIKPVIGGVTMAIFMCYFVNINVFLLTLAAGVIYIIALLLLKTFSEEDWNIIKKTLHL